jgi:hypothetical protein
VLSKKRALLMASLVSEPLQLFQLLLELIGVRIALSELLRDLAAELVGSLVTLAHLLTAPLQLFHALAHLVLHFLSAHLQALAQATGKRRGTPG